MVEVKFRRSLGKNTADQLFATLTEQRTYWPESWAVIIIGEPFPPNARFHQDYIRIIPPNATELLKGPGGNNIPTDEHDAMELLWEQLSNLSKILQPGDFRHFGGECESHRSEFWGNADFIATAIRSIRELGRL